jgi:hypothetical protein
MRHHNFIPIAKDELAAILTDEGLSVEDRDGFLSFCRLAWRLIHAEYHDRLESLQSAYAPFDPDAETKSLFKPTADETLRKQNTLFNDVARLLEEAGYRHLSGGELSEALKHASPWGLEVNVDFHQFERLAILVRGDAVQKRPLRRLRKAMLQAEIDVPIYQRVVMLLKFRNSTRRVSCDSVYLQLFKDLPCLDVNVLLPGARARLSWWDRLQIIVPIVTGLALTGWQIAQDVTGRVSHFLNDFILFKPTAVWAVASATIGYGIKSYYNYYQTKQRYNLALAQLLFYQNLDTNGGVLFRIVDEAEEQDAREAILAYFFLWRRAGEAGWTAQELEECVEQDLEKRVGLSVEFDVNDVLRRLERRHLVEKTGERFRAVPLVRALEALEQAWQGHGCLGSSLNPTPVGAK